jgi:hypothetical protein
MSEVYVLTKEQLIEVAWDAFYSAADERDSTRWEDNYDDKIRAEFERVHLPSLDFEQYKKVED